MDRLMSVAEYIKIRYTPESAPHPKTIQNRIRIGELPGVKDGGIWMVNATKLSLLHEHRRDELDDIVDFICS